MPSAHAPGGPAILVQPSLYVAGPAVADTGMLVLDVVHPTRQSGATTATAKAKRRRLNRFIFTADIIPSVEKLPERPPHFSCKRVRSFAAARQFWSGRQSSVSECLSEGYDRSTGRFPVKPVQIALMGPVIPIDPVIPVTKNRIRFKPAAAAEFLPTA